MPQRTTRSSGSGRRKRLGDIRRDYLCSIIGTCLTLRELRKLARQSGVHESELSDYDLHGLMISHCTMVPATRKLVHKALERKHAAAIRRARAAETSEDLLAYWRECVEVGRAAGAYWAVFTHPEATPEVVTEAFGDIHMLSHLQGANRRVSQQQLEQAFAESETNKQRAAELLDLLRQERSAHSRVRGLVSDLQASEVRLGKELSRERARKADSALVRECDTLRAEIAGLRTEVEAQRRRGEDAEQQRDRLEGMLRKAERKTTQVLEQRDALALEARAAEAQLDSLLSELQVDDECGRCPHRDLGGMCVLYVGGRQSLVRHYRELVQRRGGQFVHHDGGLEDQKTQLDVLVSSAGVVLCPVDAVSHDACLRVKRACRRGDRPFVPLRTCGVASLAAALHTLPPSTPG
ncbi:MAG: DUF2325 domain-containing protein [Myxococcota bacterium]